MRRIRTIVAWVLLVGSLVGWPVSAWWVWSYMGKFAPFEQLMLFLSCFAITIVAADFLTTSQVSEEQANDGEQPDARR
ncbi:hypothetical protein ACVCAH_11405 [Micromonospora sp. LZ34]